jgi:hypothetical protein
MDFSLGFKGLLMEMKLFGLENLKKALGILPLK